MEAEWVSQGHSTRGSEQDGHWDCWNLLAQSKATVATPAGLMLKHWVWLANTVPVQVASAT
jgi:hypothetical protein